VNLRAFNLPNPLGSSVFEVVRVLSNIGAGSLNLGVKMTAREGIRKLVEYSVSVRRKKT
jgi:hypothetical protein